MSALWEKEMGHKTAIQNFILNNKVSMNPISLYSHSEYIYFLNYCF